MPDRVAADLRHSDIGGVLGAIWREIASLRATVEAQGRRIEALERRWQDRRRAARPMAAVDASLLTALQPFVGVEFTTAEIVRHAGIDPDLAAALRACDLSTAQRLGKRLQQRLQGRVFEGLTVERIGQCAEGALWTIVRVDGSAGA
jgi:hypothetical protein